jgi:DNA-binding transcriptional ArsR family regulator
MDSHSACTETAIANEYSRKMKVCGHPVRLKLLCHIYRQGDPCVTNLWTSLGESQPVISQHLAILKENRVVDSAVQGNRRIYSICDDFIREVIAKMVADIGEPSPS